MLDQKIFKFNGKDVTYEDLLSKIYSNSEERAGQITKIVNHLKDTIRNTGDASVIAPWIAEYLATSVKNDDNLVKLAAIISRLIKNKPSKDDDHNFGLTPEMLEEIKREIEETQTGLPGRSK